ncbi:MAG TPA: hypothetical protein H9774_12835 [Candidatus Desulfovibrio gallistercoris]|nr:hypothetical protein [Candidatus Desulfovibrio gallistercoris]
MGRLNVKTWLGFVLNMLVVLLGISDLMLNGPTEAASLIVLMAGGLLVTGAGMVLLARGNPAGGILGAAGCILFAPTGLICLIGCLQCRDRLRSKALAAAAATAETPCAAYGFADDRAGGWLYMLGGFAAFFYGLFYYGGVLHDGGVIMAGGEVFSIIGAFRIVRACRRKQEHVCALYRDRLECFPGLWTSEPVSIPYADIREAGCSYVRLRLGFVSGDGMAKISVYFCRMTRNKRAEARSVLQDKMRELGVLREK